MMRTFPVYLLHHFL